MDLITAEEKSALEARLQELRAKRPEIVTRIAEARALGDLSENAEYHSARELQGQNEMDIRRIEERLRTAKVAGDHEIPEGMVFLGAIVKLLDLDDKSEDLYKLVGQMSGSFDFDYIEVTTTSPMGEVLMKARVGETVRVGLPKGAKRFQILQIVTE